MLLSQNRGCASRPPTLLYHRYRVPRPCSVRRAPRRPVLVQNAAAAVDQASQVSATPTAGNASSAAPAPAVHESEQVFNWQQSFYPLATVSSLKRDAPNAQQLLGRRLVVWWDKASSTWRCFEDLCPHRLAPLSEGRLHESGQLQCTYHGWRFDGAGACTAIPQLGDAKAAATACASPRSCVQSFPTQEHAGILWVYADAAPGAGGSSNGAANGNGSGSSSSQAAALQVPPELLMPKGWETKAVWFQRDVPISYDILLENFLDPAHVPHSHHGVVGDRNASHTMFMDPDRPISKAGFSLMVQNPVRLGMTSIKLEYVAPSLVRHNFPNVTMLLYGIPTAPGHSRVIMSFVAPEGCNATRPPTPHLPAWLNFMLDGIDRVPALQHALNRNAIIDGDTYFLHAAERVLYERGDASSWPRQYYMPGSSDAAVMAWRRWLDTHGAALPTLPASAADLPPQMPREQVLDRFGQHTQHCPHCAAALRGATIAACIMAAVAAVAAGSVVAAVVAGSAPLLSPFSAGAALVALLAAAATAAVVSFRRYFIYTDYVHAEH